MSAEPEKSPIEASVESMAIQVRYSTDILLFDNTLVTFLSASWADLVIDCLRYLMSYLCNCLLRYVQCRMMLKQQLRKKQREKLKRQLKLQKKLLKKQLRKQLVQLKLLAVWLH